METLAVPTRFGLVSLGFEPAAAGRDARGRRTDGGLVWLRIGRPANTLANRPSAAAKAAAAAVASWEAGEFAALDQVGVVPADSAFVEAVRGAMRRIKPGRPVSYAELAASGGRPTAIRAAASVCARNQVPIVVPCHRVVRTGGAVGNYFYGAEMKAAMLELEGWRRPRQPQ